MSKEPVPAQDSGLMRKLFNVMSELGAVIKDGANDFHNYKYVRAMQITSKVRTLFIKHQLLLLVKQMEQTADAGLTSVRMTLQIIDVESGESYEGEAIGQGADKGDKGVYKAITGALKYFFNITLLIETDDDPEADASTDRAAAGQDSPRPVRAVKSSGSAPAAAPGAPPRVSNLGGGKRWGKRQ